MQRIIDGVFESAARLVCRSHAFGNKLTHLKSVHSLRKRAMDLIRTHKVSVHEENADR